MISSFNKEIYRKNNTIPLAIVGRIRAKAGDASGFKAEKIFSLYYFLIKFIYYEEKGFKQEPLTKEQ